MDLPPDKAKVLKSYDDDKKWDMICDQVTFICCITVMLQLLLDVIYFVYLLYYAYISVKLLLLNYILIFLCSYSGLLIFG